MTTAAPDGELTHVALSHHRTDSYDRCIEVGRFHLCRRCSWLWPLSLGVMALALAGARWPDRLDPVLLVLLPLPSVVEWWLEHLGRARYSPGRQVAGTILLAPAVGVALARYLDQPTDPLFWAVVVVYGGGCLAVALWRFLDDHAL